VNKDHVTSTNRGFQSWLNEFRTSFSNDFRMREFKSDSEAIQRVNFETPLDFGGPNVLRFYL